MSEFVMYKLLDVINRNETIGILFKLGYSYSSIMKWFWELKSLGYIYIDDDASKFITTKGEKKLYELEKKYKSKEIGKNCKKKEPRNTENNVPRLLPLPRMPAAGLEPARGRPRQILSLMRLPFRHAGLFCFRIARTIDILSYHVINCKQFYFNIC